MRYQWSCLRHRPTTIRRTIFDPVSLRVKTPEDIKDIATKSGETHVQYRVPPSCEFYGDRRELSVPEQQYISLYGTPLELPFHDIHF